MYVDGIVFPDRINVDVETSRESDRGRLIFSAVSAVVPVAIASPVFCLEEA